jgi:hypothetical protein
MGSRPKSRWCDGIADEVSAGTLPELEARGGVLMVWADVPQVYEPEFDDWYNQEHLPDLAAIPGVLAAARFEAVAGGPKHLAWYALEDVHTYWSRDFEQRRRNPSLWTQRIAPSVIADYFTVFVGLVTRSSATSPATTPLPVAVRIESLHVAPQARPEVEAWYDRVWWPIASRADNATTVRLYREAGQGDRVVSALELDRLPPQGWSITPDGSMDRDPMLVRHARGSPGLWLRTMPPLPD